MSEEIVKPCPFCGGEPKEWTDGSVECGKCEAFGPESKTGLMVTDKQERSEAIKLWNKRGSDTGRLDFILKHWLVDVPNSFETPLEEQTSGFFMVFEIQPICSKLKPIYDGEPLRDVIDRAMEEEER